MIDETGGENGVQRASDLAPVIPLFGKSGNGTTRRGEHGDEIAASPSVKSGAVGKSGSLPEVGSVPGSDGEWASAESSPTWSASQSGVDSPSVAVDEAASGDRWAVPGLPSNDHARPIVEIGAKTDDAIADIVPIFAPRQRGVRFAEADGDQAEQSAEEVRDAAAEKLVRKLRSRSLSVVEARAILRAESVAAEYIDDVIDDFLRRGYLDDQVLAEQLVLSGVERKGQGRVALSRSLAQRGISRDVVDAALGEVPDDDAERALDYARTKARSLSRLDFDTALRRLVGQLARRGYNGSVAMTAARTALQEAPGAGKPKSGVRFE